MGTRHRLTLAAFATLVGCAAPAPAAPAAPAVTPPATPPEAAPSTAPYRHRIVNLMPRWWRYWERARTLPREAQVALFEEMVVAERPELFAEGVIGRDPSAPFDRSAQIADFLAGVEPLVPTMRRLSDSIERDLPGHLASFMENFPDFDWDGTVYFTISLDAFDGAVRSIAGAPQLLFGLDKIARLHGEEADLAPLFHHELFHIHHLVLRQPFDPEADNRMYQALWAEGLAVYVAHRLNPEASWQALVLNDDMVADGRKNLPSLAAEMRDNLDSSDPIFYRDWFRGVGQRKDIPNRVGYFLGYEVAKRLGVSTTLAELAELRDPLLRERIEAALAELAAGG
jgi:hypothetical protein